MYVPVCMCVSVCVFVSVCVGGYECVNLLSVLSSFSQQALIGMFDWLEEKPVPGSP